MLEKYFLRLPTPQDEQAVFELLLRCDIRDVGFPNTEMADLRRDWGQSNLARDAWLAFDAKGCLKGYCAALPWAEGVRMEIADDPGTEDTDLFLGLLVMGEKRAAAIIFDLADPNKRSICTHLTENQSHQKDLLEEAGYTIQRYVFNMVKDLAAIQPDPELPQDIRIRNMTAGQDEPAIHALAQDAFDWRALKGQTFDEWKQFMIHPDTFDENLWFLAVKDEEVIGTCLGFQYPDMGWIRQLAVKKDYRQLGIGRALLQRSFQAFKSLRLPKAGLAVESDNLDAVHFYQTAGMTIAVQLNEYVKTI